MHWFIVFTNVAALVAVKSEGWFEEKIIPFIEETTTPSVKDGDPCDLNSFSNIVCENDKLIFCGPNNKVISTDCLVQGKRGFCNCERDGCVAEKPACTDETQKCYESKTKLPDNLNCHNFIYCNSKNEKIILKCPGNLVYDPNTGKCMNRNRVPCKRIICPKRGNTLQLIPFPQAKNFYVLCYQGSGDVRKCPHKNYAVRDNKCQFDCKMQNATGVFQDTNENKCKQGIYYNCIKAGATFATVKAKCPKNMTLNENLEVCTPDEDNCKRN